MTVITIDHLYRVEGHGGIRVTVGTAGVESCEMDIFEGARFYELLLLGRHHDEVPGIVSRVCAICSAGHTLCALMAVERALGIHTPPVVDSYRELLNLGEMIESHALHLFCLAIPDFAGFSGVLAMADAYPEEVRKGLAIKRAGNRILEVVGGRAIHPINMVLGGVGRAPTPMALEELAATLGDALADALSLEGFITGLTLPDHGLEEPLLVALRPDGGEYAFTGGSLAANGHEDLPVSRFRERVNERVVRHSTAKQSLYASTPFMVGAVARLAHNGHLLKGNAARLREILLPPPLTPLHNNRAQYVELVWSLERAILLCRQLAATPPPPPPPEILPPTRGGRGEAALEVPRGTLYHAYTLDGAGLVVDADIITPTAQNLAHIERDFAAATRHWLQTPDHAPDQLRQRLEIIARAYDPCISCSTHLVDLTVKERT